MLAIGIPPGSASVLPCPRSGRLPNTFGHPPRTVFQRWDRFALTWPRNANSWPKTFRRWRPKARWNRRSVPLRDTSRHSRRRFAKKCHPTVQRYGHCASFHDRAGTFGTRCAVQGGAFGNSHERRGHRLEADAERMNWYIWPPPNQSVGADENALSTCKSRG